MPFVVLFVAPDSGFGKLYLLSSALADALKIPSQMRTLFPSVYCILRCNLRLPYILLHIFYSINIFAKNWYAIIYTRDIHHHSLCYHTLCYHILCYHILWKIPYILNHISFPFFIIIYKRLCDGHTLNLPFKISLMFMLKISRSRRRVLLLVCTISTPETPLHEPDKEKFIVCNVDTLFGIPVLQKLLSLMSVSNSIQNDS